MPEQDRRHRIVELKLNALKETVEGKRVIVVDDSIVRGTTSKSRFGLLRKAGAKEIHVRISCPLIVIPVIMELTSSRKANSLRQIVLWKKYGSI